MQGKYHFACGLTVSAIAIVMFHNTLCNSVMEPALLCIGAGVGSLIPDIDSPTSAIGKPLKPIAKIVNKAFGHRTITHTGLWLIPLALLYLKTYNSFLMGYILGFISHLFSDTLTAGGIAWVYPFNRKRLKLTKIKSGEHDRILTFITIILFSVSYVAISHYINTNLNPLN